MDVIRKSATGNANNWAQVVVMKRVVLQYFDLSCLDYTLMQQNATLSIILNNNGQYNNDFHLSSFKLIMRPKQNV